MGQIRHPVQLIWHCVEFNDSIRVWPNNSALYIFYNSELKIYDRNSCRFHHIPWRSNRTSVIKSSYVRRGQNLFSEGQLPIPWLQRSFAEDKTSFQVHCRWSTSWGVNCSVSLYNSAWDIRSWWFWTARNCVSRVKPRSLCLISPLFKNALVFFFWTLSAMIQWHWSSCEHKRTNHFARQPRENRVFNIPIWPRWLVLSLSTSRLTSFLW